MHTIVYLLDVSRKDVEKVLNKHYVYVSKKVEIEKLSEEQRQDYLVRINKLSDDVRQRFLSDTDQWNMENDGDTYLYITFYDDFDFEFEPEEIESLKVSLGKMPDVSVIAHISGRHSGTLQVHYFVSSLLSVFRGYAKDEYTDHLWILDEIINNVLVEGHCFFDYNGWYLQHN